MSTANLTGEKLADPTSGYQVQKILVAHDASFSSTQALQDAIALGRQYHSEIILARIEPPSGDLSEREYSERRAENRIELESLTKEITKNGLHGRFIVRAGLVGDSLFDISCKENADLLMLGAYGHGRQDRQTLSSTVEHLLRAIPCPVLTYGPHAQAGLVDRLNKKQPLLLAVALPCDLAQLEQAIRIARLFSIGIELIHVAEFSHLSASGDSLEHACGALSSAIRRQGVRASWSLFFGVPEVFIDACSIERQRPLIVLPLKRRDRLSSITSDNVAAQVIRRAAIPVMTYRLD
jgi:nucleotide-binding universal stress UspA family protein